MTTCKQCGTDLADSFNRISAQHGHCGPACFFARIKELEAALKPFAKYAESLDRNGIPDNCPLGTDPTRKTDDAPKVGDCHHARNVLAKGAKQ